MSMHDMNKTTNLWKMKLMHKLKGMTISIFSLMAISFKINCFLSICLTITIQLVCKRKNVHVPSLTMENCLDLISSYSVTRSQLSCFRKF